MPLKFKSILLIWFILLLSGCANHQAPLKQPATSNIKQALYKQFSEWRAVKYRFGGLSKSGIDCSGFVYLTFKDRLGIKLPRTTKQQVLSGVIIDNQNNLKSGDLVFFKTGIRQRHVGIYLEQQKFLHVSTKKGVIISYLDNPYWRKKYWQAVRVFR